MKRTTQAALRRRAEQIVATLAELYPDAKCSLEFQSPLHLLLATILAAQCTDERVNQVTPALFKKYPHAQAFAQAQPLELEKLIQPTGFFRNKAKNIIGCCQALVDRHGGEVPRTLEELVQLPGVGRKTANVVLGNCFQIPGMVVDTHMIRLSRRLGLTSETTPEKIEQALMPLLPATEWVSFGHRIIYHGRKVCQARKPACGQCALRDLCPKVDVET
jgi:endonuclease-3